ncbi:hypothetical protein PAPHI01_0779 [Pancytospora philotis]|nr:hypothetical protein PAPHI01_0779 [Pancytospora philotis]
MMLGRLVGMALWLRAHRTALDAEQGHVDGPGSAGIGTTALRPISTCGRLEQMLLTASQDSVCTLLEEMSRECQVNSLLLNPVGGTRRVYPRTPAKLGYIVLCIFNSKDPVGTVSNIIAGHQYAEAEALHDLLSTAFADSCTLSLHAFGIRRASRLALAIERRIAKYLPRVLKLLETEIHSATAQHTAAFLGENLQRRRHFDIFMYSIRKTAAPSSPHTMLGLFDSVLSIAFAAPNLEKQIAESAGPCVRLMLRYVASNDGDMAAFREALLARAAAVEDPAIFNIFKYHPVRHSWYEKITEYLRSTSSSMVSSHFIDNFFTEHKTNKRLGMAVRSSIWHNYHRNCIPTEVQIPRECSCVPTPPPANPVDEPSPTHLPSIESLTEDIWGRSELPGAQFRADYSFQAPHDENSPWMGCTAEHLTSQPHAPPSATWEQWEAPWNEGYSL